MKLRNDIKQFNKLATANKKLAGERWEAQKERNKYIKKSEIRGMLLIVIFVTFVCSWLVIPNYNKTIDEAGWCLNKLNTEFPEYNFISASHSNSVCTGLYSEQTVQRDGLREQGKQLAKSFMLTNENDIAYLSSDDTKMILIGFGMVVWFMVIVICASFADARRWWKYE